jgi:phosphate transport system substrate-binding protein
MRVSPCAWLCLIFGCLAALQLAGCGSARPGTLRVATSTIPAPVVKNWVEEITKLPRPFDASLSVIGSTAAIEQLLEGQLDLVVTSRRMTLNEFLASQSRGRKLQEVLIGFGIYQVLVNPQNAVASLTLEQVGAVFSRRVKDWSEVGGPKLPLVCVYRRTQPGDVDLFFDKEVAVDLQPNPSIPDAGIVVADDTAAIVAAVQANPGAIGYLLTSDPTPELKALAIQGKLSQTPLPPSVESALSGQYPMLRPLYMYVDAAAPPTAAYFREFAEGAWGRKSLATEGFSPVPLTRKPRSDPYQPVMTPDW